MREAFGLFDFAVNDPGSGLFPDRGAEKSQQFVAAGVGAEAVDRADFAFHVVPAIENAHALRALLQTTAEGLRGNIAAEDDEIVDLLHTLGEVVENSAEFARRAGSDDDARAGLGIDLLALLGS